MHSSRRQLTLYKRSEKFVFGYEQGQEDQLRDVLIEYARESQTSFDWFDATVLSLRLASPEHGGPVQTVRRTTNVCDPDPTEELLELVAKITQEMSERLTP
jgi:hypothetical protein